MSLDQGEEIVKSDAVSHDAFLGGKLYLSQPKAGFRAGTDSVLLGAAVAHSSKLILDLGSGVGAASLCALARLPDADARLVEINENYAALALSNIKENGFADRAKILSLDVTSSGSAREAAGLYPNQFTSVIANPPYFDSSAGSGAPDKARADARAMPADGLDKWVRTAAFAAAAGGEIIFIYRASGLTDLLSAFKRFGATTVLPIVARPGEEASRVLVRAIKGSRAPMVLKSPLNLHDQAGNAFAPEIAAILREGSSLHW